MNEERRAAYEQRYQAAKAHGVRFFPEIIYKDFVVSFALFLLLVGLAAFVGVAAEAPADPGDATYVPRPEWYFLWLFQMLKYFPGRVEWLGTTVVPVLGVLLLVLLPFYDRNPFRNRSHRPVAMAALTIGVVGIVALTGLAAIGTPAPAEGQVAASLADRIVQGQDLFGVQCAECHGDEGDLTEIVGVEGLEGRQVTPLHSPDFMYTRTDETIFQIIDQGQQDLGMQPFGLGHGGELSVGDINAIVAFMRYSWDDRMTLPPEAAAAGAVPTLAPGEVPSYEVHVEPIVRRACLSCHRPGRENGNYLMQTYQEILQTGDAAPNVIAGQPDQSNLILLVRRVEGLEVGRPMPPSKPLNPEWVEVLERWVAAGMPETAADAEAAASR